MIQLTDEGRLVSEPKPGQMYAWSFSINDGTWLVEAVTEDRRRQPVSTSWMCLKRGELFTIVTIDDPGPYEVPHYRVVEADGTPSALPTLKPRKRWHTAIRGDRLFWLDDELLRFSDLVRE